jgi:motility quorum-sensing regulator / GCU-specific mRNA interferase toxin
MEKRIAHYSLIQVRAMVSAGRVRATRTAMKDAVSLGFVFKDMKHIVQNLKPKNLYKSMTSHYDDTVWQDVYHYPAVDVDLYIKIQIVGEVVIISFKEL